MTQIFASGSRSVHFLPTDAIAALNRIIDQKFNVLVGDCHGTDVAIQRYLKTRNYKNVTVYHIGASPRTNIGFNAVRVNGNFQTDKDKYMAGLANFGLAVWDGQSKGTAQNIERIKTKVIAAPTDATKCIVCGAPSENGSTRLPMTFHPPSNPRIPVCINCYRSGRLKTEVELRGFSS